MKSSKVESEVLKNTFETNENLLYFKTKSKRQQKPKETKETHLEDAKKLHYKAT